MRRSGVVLLLFLLAFAPLISAFRIARTNIIPDDTIYDDEGIDDTPEVADGWRDGSVKIGKYEAVTVFVTEPLEDEQWVANPIQVLTGSDVISPQLEGESLDDLWEDDIDAFWSELFVKYYCKKAGEAKLALTISIKRTTFEGAEQSFNITLMWTKVCDVGSREGISVGLSDGSADVIDNGQVGAEWAGSTIINPTTHGSTFYISLSPDFGSEILMTPVVKVQDPDVLEVLVRGEASHDDTIVLEEQPRELSLIYECQSSGVTTVTVSLKLPPWNAIDFSFQKDCGGGSAGGLRILRGDTREVVYADGETKKPWTIDFSEEAKPSITATDYRTTFLLESDNEDYSWEHIVLSPEPSRLMSPYISYDGQYDVDGGLISATPRELTIYYNCQKKGEGKMHVTLKMPLYESIEFSWKKQCVKMEPEVDTSVWTANQALLVFILATAIVGGGGYYYYRSRAAENRRAAAAGGAGARV